jgi:hypothetical protein
LIPQLKKNPKKKRKLVVNKKEMLRNKKDLLKDRKKKERSKKQRPLNLRKTLMTSVLASLETLS